jgi:hypothetical protein
MPFVYRFFFNAQALHLCCVAIAFCSVGRRMPAGTVDVPYSRRLRSNHDHSQAPRRGAKPKAEALTLDAVLSEGRRLRKQTLSRTPADSARDHKRSRDGIEKVQRERTPEHREQSCEKMPSTARKVRFIDAEDPATPTTEPATPPSAERGGNRPVVCDVTSVNRELFANECEHTVCASD